VVSCGYVAIDQMKESVVEAPRKLEPNAA
jgi:hypothetical protein